ncbi:MAG: O-antigen ligase family protein, partial [Solirubrobacterales bacterium]|nr:O-antigen ligase family protein [Solirubrobacterales bacterium]
MALAVVALALVLMLRVTLVDRPFAGLGVGFVIAAGALVLLCAWTLASSLWSNAPARAIVEYDRTLLYLLAFVIVGAAGRTDTRMRTLARGLALGIVVVGVAGLLSRTLPDVFPVELTIVRSRLSFPLTYWNAMGVLMAIGVVLCFALTSDDRERMSVRMVAAGALPALAATLLLTYSRGGIAAAAAGLVVALVVGRPRAVAGALLATVPAVTFAVVTAYDAGALATDTPTSAAAVDQGHRVALVVAACMVGAAVLRGALAPLDGWLVRLRAPALLRGRSVLPGTAAVVAIAIITGALALGVPAEGERQYDRFVRGGAIPTSGDSRARLTNVASNGRVDFWSVALDAHRKDRALGAGAGTFPLLWERDREFVYQVEDAHSLYLEVLAELGIVGLVLLAIAVAFVLGGFLVRARGPDRALYGGVFAAALLWAVHAGIDWDWEMPAVTAWVFGAAGLALATPPMDGAPTRALGRPARIVLALGCLAIVVLPARAFLSAGPLRDSALAFERGDCPAAIDAALDSIAALGQRPEPFAILGYCDVRVGAPRLGVRALGNAVARDPGNWEYHYGLAIVRGAAELDPRPAARQAAGLNPGEPLVRDALRRFDTDDPTTWRRRALSAR